MPGRSCRDARPNSPHFPVARAVKVVLRGARRTGKTSLLRRLQGQPVVPEYAPTPEIETAVIRWAYKNADDKM